MIELLDYFSQFIREYYYLAPLLSLLSGILASLMPCNLSTLPLVLAYVNSSSRDFKKSLSLSVIFAIGNALTYVILAVLAVALGTRLGINSNIFNIFIVVLLLLMALQMYGLYEFVPSNYLVSKNKYKGRKGAFITGAFSGLFSSSCSTPILVVLLSLISTSNNFIFGIINLLAYSIGHSFLVIIIGSSSVIYNKFINKEKTKKIMIVVNYLLATLVMIFAFYLAYLNF